MSVSAVESGPEAVPGQKVERLTDLVAAMAVVGDLLAATLPFEGQWSPELDKAREAGRTLLKEWSARR